MRSLGHLVFHESEEVLLKDEDILEGIGTSLKVTANGQTNTMNTKLNNNTIDYNLQNKMNIYK